MRAHSRLRANEGAHTAVRVRMNVSVRLQARERARTSASIAVDVCGEILRYANVNHRLNARDIQTSVDQFRGEQDVHLLAPEAIQRLQLGTGPVESDRPVRRRAAVSA